VAGFCEYGIRPSISINGKEFLDQLSEYYLVKEGTALWSWFHLITGGDLLQCLSFYAQH